MRQSREEGIDAERQEEGEMCHERQTCQLEFERVGDLLMETCREKVVER